MFSSSREMYAHHQLKYFSLALLILPSLWVTEAINTGRSRRRPALSGGKQAIDDVTQKSDTVTDQLALAASRTEPNQFRRGGAYSSEPSSDGDFTYGNLEMNLIRPDSNRIHTQITAKYSLGTGTKNDPISLDDAETAEEYVAKAMNMYGTRFREPIRIPSEPQELPKETPMSSGGGKSKTNYDFYELSKKQEQPHKQYQGEQQTQPKEQFQREQQKQLQLQQYQREQQEQPQLQHFQGEQQEQPQLQHFQGEQQEQSQLQQFQREQQEQPQLQQFQREQQEQSQLQQFQREQQPQVFPQEQQQEEQPDHKAQLDKEMRAQLQAQMQQAQQLANHHQAESQATNDESNGSATQPPAPVYEKDPVTRSYEVYDDHLAYDGSQALERHYRTKYAYQPAAYRPAFANEQEQDKLRVSASTEIPKAEIMKQIEKSVMKYMKELEAEGKIGPNPPKPEQPKTYYKMVTVPVANDEKRITSTTTRPKFSGSTSAYYAGYGGGPSSAAPSSQQSNGGHHGPNRHHMPKHGSKQQQYQSETETAYQAPEMADAMAPNVEFIYKIKTRAPLQTATVKTVSKPYSLPLKGTYDQFDHSAALKNLEEFDLSHVVSVPESEDHPGASSSGKPNKLYFNSEIYHDINSLPFKSEKTRTLAAEYLKAKANDLEYKGYSGYFAEPSSADSEKELSPSSSSVSEDGYPVMNPYQFVLKKEPLPSKYDDASSSSSANWEQPRTGSHNKPHYASLSSQKALEYDSYSPKFNNNPDGYGYQHTYKTHTGSEREQSHGNHAKYPQRHQSNNNNNKRGKRGGTPYPNVVKKVRSSVKDIEANLALRPPPKA